MKHFLYVHGLFLLTLSTSMAGHLALRWLEPTNVLEFSIPPIETGENSVSIQLVAMAPSPTEAWQPPEAIDCEQMESLESADGLVTEDVSLDIDRLAFLPPVRRHRSQGAETHRVANPSPPVVQRDPVRQTPDRMEQVAKQLERQETDRNLQLPEGKVEIPETVVAAQSSGQQSPPSYRSRTLPGYPRHLLLARVEATVRLAVTISRDGRVRDARVHQSSGYAAMDEAALKAIRGWTFHPARRGSTPVLKRVIVPVEFRIQR